jgi:hypothetical protein
MVHSIFGSLYALSLRASSFVCLPSLRQKQSSPLQFCMGSSVEQVSHWVFLASSFPLIMTVFANLSLLP